jgi:hypothetical protein
VNCLDCSRDLEAERPAVAVCFSCGGAVCNAHSSISYARRPVGPGTGQSRTTGLRARTVRCLVCAQASEGSVADQAARALRTNRFRNFWKRRTAQEASSGLGSPTRPRIELDPTRPD